MKPNVKSPYFFLSLLSFALYFVTLFFSRTYVLDTISKKAEHPWLVPLYIMGIAYVGVGAWLWRKSAHPEDKPVKQLLIFILTPLTLAPVLSLIYGVVVLIPIYSLVGSK